MFSPSFIRNLRVAFGQAVTQAWLARLPSLIADLERRWDIRVEAVLPDLSYNYVAYARRSAGQEVVLKVGIPNPELVSEIEALRLYDGAGAVRVLEYSFEQGALLMERIQPGTMLADLALRDDETATMIAAEAMRRLRRPLAEAHPFHPMRDWVRALTDMRWNHGGASGPMPEQIVAVAERLCAELLDSTPEVVLLHGDLHHFNLLMSAENGWVVIDPKGVAGDPAYEPATLFLNPNVHQIDDATLKRLTARRIEQVSERLALDSQRVWAWAVVHAVLSACWDIDEDGQGWQGGLRCAEVFRSLRP